MKNLMMTRKNAPRFVDANHVLVTREFAKNARIFGTPEYKLWREICKDCEKAEMVTKTIKKNPDKKNDTKNMTYERMAIYIREQENAAVLMAEFQKQIALSKVQTNPYRCVLAWFMQTFQNYDNYKTFFEEQTKEAARKKDIFNIAGFPAVIDGGNSGNREYKKVS